MDLASTLEIYSGGLGSGCKGPKCGRPTLAYPAKRNVSVPTGDYIGNTPRMYTKDEYYHGTTLDMARKIVQEGLHQGTSLKLSGNLKSTKGYVYLTDEESVGKGYAKFRSDYEQAGKGGQITFRVPGAQQSLTKTGGGASEATPAVVRFTLPRSEQGKLQRDPDSIDNVSYRRRGSISPSHVNGVSVKIGGKWVEVPMDELLK